MYDDGHKHCFACNLHIHIDGTKEDFELAEYTYEYLPWRGISKETMKRYDVKTKINSEGEPVSVGFKYPNGAYKVRELKEKNFHTQGEINKAGLFGRDKFEPGVHKYVTITEGEVDALSLSQALGGYPVVSVQSSSTAARDCGLDDDRAWLNSFERIYIAFDADEHGRQAFLQVSRMFDYNKVYFVRFTKRKDANEFLSAGEGEDLKRIWWNSKLYVPDTIKSSFEDFELLLDNPRKIGIPYPFDILNKFTAGIRTSETVLITAQEKVGKTELMHFIEHQILKETKDNVAAIFLEELPQRHLQALAGIELKDPIHLPHRDRPREEVVKALREVVQEDGRLHIYSHFGSDNPASLLDTIRFLATSRNCKYILFDHISMVVSGLLSGGSDVKQLDYLASRLEMLVKELDIALIMVSHVNDFGQTRGSHYITKVVDIQINATRDLMSDNSVERNTIHLSIPISRYPGLTGKCGSILFDRETYSFTEKEADNEQNSDPLSFDTHPVAKAA